MRLTCEQLTAIMQIISDEDIYLDVESKAKNKDVSFIKVTFFNIASEESEPYFFDQEGELLTTEEYNAK